MQRKQCPRCSVKHLAKAAALYLRSILWLFCNLLKPITATALRACVSLAKAKILGSEAKLGYPEHIWHMLANMSEAEDEIVDVMPDEAAEIRAERLAMEDALRAGDTTYRPDFKRLLHLVAEGGMLEETL